MTDTYKRNLTFGIILSVLFIIWMPLVACGCQGVVDATMGYSQIALHTAWLGTWMRCLQTSWAFLAFMLITIITWFFVAKGGNSKVNNYNFKTQEVKEIA